MHNFDLSRTQIRTTSAFLTDDGCGSNTDTSALGSARGLDIEKAAHPRSLLRQTVRPGRPVIRKAIASSSAGHPIDELTIHGGRVEVAGGQTRL